MSHRLIILDTHVWLWWANCPEKLSRAAREAIDQAERLAIASISCWEVAMLAEAGRLELDRVVETWIEHALAETRTSALALGSEVAVQAALLGRERFGGDPADRIIYATARSLDAPLVTRDRGLREFDPRRTIW